MKRKRTGGLVTITEINEDELMAVANQNWAPGSKAAAKGSFKPKLVGGGGGGFRWWWLTARGGRWGRWQKLVVGS